MRSPTHNINNKMNSKNSNKDANIIAATATNVKSNKINLHSIHHHPLSPSITPTAASLDIPSTPGLNNVSTGTTPVSLSNSNNNKFGFNVNNNNNNNVQNAGNIISNNNYIIVSPSSSSSPLILHHTSNTENENNINLVAPPHKQVCFLTTTNNWYVMPQSLSKSLFWHLDHVAFTWSNIIDYFRVLIVLFGFLLYAFSSTHNKNVTPYVAAIIIVSYLLDWIDGPVARRTNTCTTFGANLDWTSDILTNVLMALMWHHVAPTSCAFLGWTFCAAEITYMVFDIIASSRGVYADVLGHVRDEQHNNNNNNKNRNGSIHNSKNNGFSPFAFVRKCFVEILVRSNINPAEGGKCYKYSGWYTITWIVYPVTVCTLIADISLGGVSSLLSFSDFFLVPSFAMSSSSSSSNSAISQSSAASVSTSGFSPFFQQISNQYSTSNSTITALLSQVWLTWVLLNWTLGVAISCWFCIVDAYLAFALSTGWCEDRPIKSSEYHVLYDDRRTNQNGGLLFLRKTQHYLAATTNADNKSNNQLKALDGKKMSSSSQGRKIPTGNTNQSAVKQFAVQQMHGLFPESFDLNKSNAIWSKKIINAIISSTPTYSSGDMMKKNINSSTCVFCLGNNGVGTPTSVSMSSSMSSYFIQYRPVNVHTKPHASANGDITFNVTLPPILNGDVLLLHDGVELFSSNNNNNNNNNQQQQQNTSSFLIVEFNW